MSSELIDDIVVEKMKPAFLGFSIYKDLLLPVYDLNACLEILNESGMSEDEVAAYISGEQWMSAFNSVRPLFWLGNPEVEESVVH